MIINNLTEINSECEDACWFSDIVVSEMLVIKNYIKWLDKYTSFAALICDKGLIVDRSIIKIKYDIRKNVYEDVYYQTLLGGFKAINNEVFCTFL